MYVECRSSHRSCSVRKSALRNFAKFTGKHLCHSLFCIKVAGLRLQLYLKKRLWQRFFPVNFAKFLRTPFLQNTYGWLLLWMRSWLGKTQSVPTSLTKKFLQGRKFSSWWDAAFVLMVCYKIRNFVSFSWWFLIAIDLWWWISYFTKWQCFFSNIYEYV